MEKVHRYKIKKLNKISNGHHNKCTDKNFKLEKRSVTFRSLEYLLEKRVYPYGFDFKNNLVFFVETDSVIDNNKASFFYEPLQKQAEYFIKVGFDDFCSLIDENELSKGNNIIFIHHPGRCGSTLLHKLLGSNPQIESFSEDLIFDNLFIYGDSHWEEKKNILIKLISFLYTKWGAPDKKLIFKMTGWSIEFYKTMFETLPLSKHIYITRDAYKICESFINLMTTNPIYKYLYRYSRVIYFKMLNYNMLQNKWYNLNKYIHLKVISPNIKKIRKINVCEGFILRVLIYDLYFGFFDHKNILRIDFDDLINKDKIIQLLDDFLQMQKKELFDLSIYDRHSQAGSIADTSIVKRYKLSKKRRTKLETFKHYVEELILM